MSAANLASGQVKPNFNVEVILRPPGDGDGFGHVKFSQANDDATIVDLGCAILHRILTICFSVPWTRSSTTRGTGRKDLFRTLPAAGAFDIHFRVVAAASPTVAVLTSDCYQFFVR